jgi:hypothetical protein
MKTGYSMLLGEYINAKSISYTDCKSFQIVCPICREPIFKVERNEPPPTIHYLSHYEASKSFADDCELRVKSISTQDQDKENNVSRGQKLEYFLSVLREEVLKREFGTSQENVEKVRQVINRMMSAPGVQIFRDIFHKHQLSNHEMNKPENLSIIFDEYVKDIEKVGGSFPITGFVIATQKRIATDIWLHLLSAKAMGNFTFLFCCGYLTFSARIEQVQRERSLYQFERDFLVALERLIRVGRQNAENVLHVLGTTPIGPPHAISGSNYIAKVASEICHEVFGILLRLPYFDMLVRLSKAR